MTKGSVLQTDTAGCAFPHTSRQSKSESNFSTEKAHQTVDAIRFPALTRLGHCTYSQLNRYGYRRPPAKVLVTRWSGLSMKPTAS